MTVRRLAVSPVDPLLAYAFLVGGGEQSAFVRTQDGGKTWVQLAHAEGNLCAFLSPVFTPDPAKIEYARRVVEVFEDGVRRGTASVNLDGKMVDVPVYKRAQVIMARAELVAATERRKAAALKRNG